MLSDRHSIFIALLGALFEFTKCETAALLISRPDTCLAIQPQNLNRTLVYRDGSEHSVGVPYQRGASAQLIAEIAYILLREVMGYSTVMFDLNSIFSPEMINYVAGCFNPDDIICSSENRDADHPKVHFSLETWTNGIIRAEKTLPLNIRPQLLGVLNYDLADGFFLWKRTLQAGLDASEPILLDSFRAYDATRFEPSRVSI